MFLPKITGIGQLLLKLSYMVGWYTFNERHSVELRENWAAENYSGPYANNHQ